MIRVSGKNLKGSIEAIPSKSYAHRALIAASLSHKPSKIKFSRSSKDIDYTISCLKSLGSEILDLEEGGVEVNPIKTKDESPILDVGESGTTFRLILPLASAIYEECKFVGKEGLARRPIIELMEAMEVNGVKFSADRLPFTSKGKLNSGVFRIPGDISSQYISGLLFAAPLLEGKTEISLTSSLESKAYVDITMDILNKFGIQIKSSNGRYQVERQDYKSKDYSVEGDWSNAAFFLVAGALGHGITMTGLNMKSSQGDIKILDILEDLGASLQVKDKSITISKNKLSPIEVDLSEIPDSLPVLAVAAASVEGGVSRFYNGKRLRIKESDRLNSVATMIRNLGGRVEEKEEELLVYGTGGLKGGRTSSFGDHRLVMAASIASMISEEDVAIKNFQDVSKSYPLFFEDFEKIGGVIVDL